ncbi:MAG: hypothetical protein O2782_03470 [bacterium]|nr:hypothetical protein [bacterium]
MPTRDNAVAEEETTETSVVDGKVLRERVLSLARRITRLAEDDEDVEIEEPDLGHRLAMSVKPYVDRLVTLRHLLNPVGRIIEKREQIEELRDEIADDIATVEDASHDLGETVDFTLITELQTELAAVKRERKLFVEDDEEEEEDEDHDDDEDDDDVSLTDPADGKATVEDQEEGQEEKLPGGRRPFLERPLIERMRLVLGPRLIDLDRLAGILGGRLPDGEHELAEKRLERVWDGLMQIEQFSVHAKNEQLGPLRRALRDYVLLYRTAQLPHGDGEVPCSISELKDRMPSRFVGSSDRSLWYSGLQFYRESFSEGHWALLDRQYLNCTFKLPKIRLGLYARANQLPLQGMRQKSVLEDVYDRVIANAAMEAEFFDNCNSLTRTTYQQKDEPSKKQVHVYYRAGQIRISGKRGLPHWRPGKPRWPGVFPAIVFDQQVRD